jgi:hyaluronan synthase
MPTNIFRPDKSKPSSVRPSRFTLDRMLKIIVPPGLLIALIISLQIGSFNGYIQLFRLKSYTSFLTALGATYTLALLAFHLVRTFLWWRYQAYPLPTGTLPSVTVIIPAFNEGAMVEKSIYSVAASDYPADQLEIICIDDGSLDDTWHYIQEAQERYPHLIRAIKFTANRGKREALYAGFIQGRGEYFITVDSDSVIEPDTIKQILAPLLQDPQIGGVAGNVKVYNRTRNLLTRMLGIRFILSFDFLRASQSMYGAVFCTPGALSAYRREAIMSILEEWRAQTFLGVPCTIGEDRAFTNLILRQGYYTVYQRSAVVYTVVPENYRNLSRMFLRWDRSNFRESFIQLSYLFTRYRKKHRLLPILDFFVRELEFPITSMFFPLVLLSFLCCPIVIVKFITAMALVSFVFTYFYLREERSFDFIYGILFSYYSFLFLRWIKPFAFLTLRNGRWLTR